MSLFKLAKAEIQFAFLDERRECIREHFEDLYYNITLDENCCLLEDYELQNWFFANFLFIEHQYNWEHKLKVLC